MSSLRPFASCLLVVGVLALSRASAAAQDAATREVAGYDWSPVVRPLPRAPVAPPETEARLVLAMESFATSATGALAANSLESARVVRALTGMGVPGARIRTSEPRLLAEYERRGPLLVRTGMDARRPRIVGYYAVSEVLVRPERAEQLGPLMDAAVAAGARPVPEFGPGW